MILKENSGDSLNSFINKSYNYNTTNITNNYLDNLLKSLNIIDPEQLRSEDLSIIFQRVDDYEGLFTTQQLENVDYSDFKNHVIFDSAVDKVSYAFNKIQNTPYDKNKIENIKFLNRMDGYTNYLLKNVYPTSTGYAEFDGTNMIVVYDEQAKILNDTNKRDKNILNPKDKNFSFDFWLNPKNDVNYQTVFSKVLTYIDTNDNNEIKIDNGFLCYTKNIDNEKCELNFSIYINKKSKTKKISIDKNVFQNINISITKEKEINFAINGNIENSIEVGTSSLISDDFSELFNSSIPISLGSVFILNEGNIDTSLYHDNNQMNKFTGSIDEFRFFHKLRSYKTIKKEMNKNIYAQRDLKLYLRLNEPSGNYTNSCLCIDFSGNKLHGVMYSITNGILNIASDTTNFKINHNTPLTLEKKEDSPVLNSAFTEVVSKRNDLILEAKNYDANNPSLIFNLMPKHYFLNASELENLPVYSNNSENVLPNSLTFDNNNIDNRSNLSLQIPANNELVNITLIWARFFDKLKLYISSITNLLNVDYDSINKKSVISMQVPLLCKLYGIKFKEIFSSTSNSKLENENLKYEDVLSELSIRKIQNILWQRFLINTQEFLKSKGTISSINSVFNSFGIESRNLIDIREYSTINNIKETQNFSIENVKKNYINFANSKVLSSNNEISDQTRGVYQTNNYYIPTERLLLIIDDIKVKSNDQSKDIDLNNFIISDSLNNENYYDWSIETIFNFKELLNRKNNLKKFKLNQKFSSPENKNYNDKQLLFVVGNDIVVIYKENDDIRKTGDIIVRIKYQTSQGSVTTTTFEEIKLENVDLFNTEKYFVLSKSENNNLCNFYCALIDLGKDNKNIIENNGSIDYNSNSVLSDSKFNITNIKIGSGSFRNNRDYAFELFDFSYLNDDLFQGDLYKIRLWSKSLSKNEINSHSNNLNNIGTDDFYPYRHLVFDFCIKDETRYSQDENLFYWKLEDLSNNKIVRKTNGVLERDTNRNIIFDDLNICNLYTLNSDYTSFDLINTNEISIKKKNKKFDENIKYNKFNIVSYENQENKVKENNFNIFPAHEVPDNFVYDSATRTSIDMSIVKTLNKDIENIISDLNNFNLKVKNFSNKFEYQYKFINDLREDYFSKFSDSVLINYASLGSIFKYFDNIMSSILFDIVPSNVSFEGFNFVYESHILERHKYEHKNKDSINTIVSQDEIYSFSRDNLNFRRSLQYNNNRTQRKS